MSDIEKLKHYIQNSVNTGDNSVIVNTLCPDMIKTIFSTMNGDIMLSRINHITHEFLFDYQVCHNKKYYVFTHKGNWFYGESFIFFNIIKTATANIEKLCSNK